MRQTRRPSDCSPQVSLLVLGTVYICLPVTYRREFFRQMVLVQVFAVQVFAVPLLIDGGPNSYQRRGYLGDLQTIRSKFSMDCQSSPEFYPNCTGRVVRSAGRGLEGIH